MIDDDFDLEVYEGDAVMVFRENGDIAAFVPEDPLEPVEDGHPMWRVFLVATLFRQDDDEVSEIRERLAAIADELDFDPDNARGLN